MKFGIRNATQNASVVAFAPNAYAIAISRTRPNRREMNVIALKDSMERRRDGRVMIDRLRMNP
jgi:hypothetical protein